MRKLHLLLFSAAGALAMGLLWTVAQTGSADTSAHLCEFAHHFSADVPADCHAADWIASAAGWLFVLAVLVALADMAWIVASWKGWGRRKAFDAMPAAPALQIHFDPANPARRHWSFESPRDAEGKSLPGLVHEYRVAIFNPTTHTIRNVGVNVEFLGPSGPRPYQALFDKDRSVRRDIDPGCFELVPVLHWPHPKRRAGDFAEPTSFVAYGPMVVKASADNVAPVIRQFWFSQEREPMLFDALTSEEEGRVKALLERP